jgi:DNA-binding transcriptional regulator YhcF (GntR family)
MVVKYKKDADWKQIERQYRAGLLSVCEIARESGVAEATIRYHAKKNGWKRDLTDEVRRSTRTKMVENLASVFDGGKGAVDQLRKLSDEEIIEEASRTQVEVVRQHQRSLGHGHSLTMRLLGELDATTTNKEQLEELIKSDIPAQRQRAMLNAVSVGSRATVLRDLAIAAKTWITLERQAFNIVDDRDKDNKELNKLNEMTAEELRQEIVSDAKKLGMSLEEIGSMGIAPKGANGKTTH